MTDSVLTGILCDLARYEALTITLDHLPAAVALFEVGGAAVYMNPEFKRLHFGDLHHSESEFPSVQDYIEATQQRNWSTDPREFLAVAYETLLRTGMFDGQIEIDGRIIAVHDVLIGNRYVLTTQKDITERILMEREITYRASHDHLTSLANRSSFEAQAARVLSEAATTGRRFALLMVDLDRFKGVNDRFGHAAGDTVLQEMACRFRASLGRNDFVARLGGDEFIFLCNEPEAETCGAQLAHRLAVCANLPIEFEGHPLSVGVSVGYALFPDHGSTLEELKRSADVALYAVKNAGRGSARCFDFSLTSVCTSAAAQTAA